MRCCCPDGTHRVQVRSADGVGITLPPRSASQEITVNILPITADDLACALESTRFQPFGYKEIAVLSPAVAQPARIDPPARVYWEIPERYQSLEQLKFLQTPSRELCQWGLKANISLETRTDDAGAVSFWAYTDGITDASAVYALARVLPLVDKEVPNTVIYQEDTGGVRIAPSIDLRVREENEWRQKYPNLRVRSMNVSLVQGFEPGQDQLSLPSVPGFSSSFDSELGILTIDAVPGYDFTEDTAEDYEEDEVERVNVAEVYSTVDATARLADFNAALRMVEFRTTTLGAADRSMELSVDELLTADVVATISWAQIINNPEPPEIYPSPFPGVVVEKAALTPVDPGIQVRPCMQEVILSHRPGLLIITGVVDLNRHILCIRYIDGGDQ